MRKTTERLPQCCSLVWFMLQKCAGRKLGPDVTSLRHSEARKRRSLQEVTECEHPSVQEGGKAGIMGVDEFPQNRLFIKRVSLSPSRSDHISFLPQCSWHNSLRSSDAICHTGSSFLGLCSQQNHQTKKLLVFTYFLVLGIWLQHHKTDKTHGQCLLHG